MALFSPAHGQVTEIHLVPPAVLLEGRLVSSADRGEIAHYGRGGTGQGQIMAMGVTAAAGCWITGSLPSERRPRFRSQIDLFWLGREGHVIKGICLVLWYVSSVMLGRFFRMVKN